MDKKESKTTKVDVLIGGEIITLKSSEEPEYLQRLARYVDQKTSDVTSSSKSAVIDERVRSLLITLNIADDYFKVFDGFKELESVQKMFAKEMGRMQEENTLLQQKLKELQDELTKTRTEFDDFLQTFDKDNEKSDNILTLPRNEARKAAR